MTRPLWRFNRWACWWSSNAGDFLRFGEPVPEDAVWAMPGVFRGDAFARALAISVKETVHGLDKPGQDAGRMGEVGGVGLALCVSRLVVWAGAIVDASDGRYAVGGEHVYWACVFVFRRSVWEWCDSCENFGDVHNWGKTTISNSDHFGLTATTPS